jgi:hypothetical protein
MYVQGRPSANEERKERGKMPQVMKKDQVSPEEKSLRVVTYWLFVVAVFSWAIPFTLLSVFSLLTTGGDKWAAMGAALWPSIATLAVTVVLSAITFFIYKKMILKA